MPRKHTKQRVAWWSEEFKRLLAVPAVLEGVPKVIDGFQVPVWWECTWRRTPCKKQSCRFCGRFEKVKRLLGLPDAFAKGKSKEHTPAEAVEESFATPENDLADLKEVTAFQAKDFGIRENEVLGEDALDDFDDEGNYIGEEETHERIIPEPESFLLYRLVKRWSRPLTRFVGEKNNRGVSWAKSEAAGDLLWYGTLIIGKVYRQLSTKWEISNGLKTMEDVKVEYVYTGYVLREISNMVEQSLIALSKSSADLKTPLRQFRRFKPNILQIAKM